ncbi:MAG: DUF1269 domain-containing protein [Methanotrichaceae archaeon]|jgi:uncharacterized membrane protein
MAELVAIVYPNEGRAAEVLAKLRELSSEYLVDLEDAVIVIKNAKGKVKLHQTMDFTETGAILGAFWGMLIGLLFLMPMGGLIFGAIGAVSGAIGGKLADYGIDDDFAKSLSNEMKPGSSAIFMLVRKATTDKVEPELAKFGGKIMRTSLSKDAETKLQTMMDEANKIEENTQTVSSDVPKEPDEDILTTRQDFKFK